jgi:hypothetical protein
MVLKRRRVQVVINENQRAVGRDLELEVLFSCPGDVYTEKMVSLIADTILRSIGVTPRTR